MPATVAALEYLATRSASAPPGGCVVFGDEPYLKSLVLRQWRRAILDDDEGDFSYTVFEGDAIEWRDVHDELATVALFGGGRRLIQVDAADGFVSKHRATLETYVAKPRSTGVLVLNVASWPSNTRLFKAVDALGLAVDASTPPEAALLKWLIARAKSPHQFKLDRPAAEALLEIIGPHLGQLDQELAKLAASVGIDGSATIELVEKHVVGSRARQVWDMLDAALAGQAADAAGQLDRLLNAGEEPIALLGQIGASLRRLAAVAPVGAVSDTGMVVADVSTSTSV